MILIYINSINIFFFLISMYNFLILINLHVKCQPLISVLMVAQTVF